MRNQIEHLMDIAKRLDDMSEDGPSELLTLSEEIGKIADSLLDTPLPGPNREVEMPHWLREMQRLMERSALEIIAERYRHALLPDSRSFTVNLPNPDYQNYLRMSAQIATPPAQFKPYISGV